MFKKLSLGLGMAILLAAMSFSAELVLNGGLDNWTDGVPDGNWSLVQVDGNGTPGGTKPTITQESTDKHGGISSLKIHRTTTDAIYKYCAHTNPISGLSGDVNFSFWIKRIPASTTCGIYLSYSTDGGITWKVDNTKNGVSTADGWQNLTGTWTLTAGPLYRLSVHTRGSGDTYYDDVSLTGTTGTPVPVELSEFTTE